jgi:hypothetical protein
MKCKSTCLNGKPCSREEVFGGYCIKHYEILLKKKLFKVSSKN